MKKTLIALMAMAGVTYGSIPKSFCHTVAEQSGLNLSEAITLNYESAEYFIKKTGDDTSPAVGAFVMSFSLTDIPVSGTNQNLIHVRSSDIGTAYGQSQAQNSYGFFVNGNTLTFGKSNCDASNTLTAFSKTDIFTALEANTTYTLTLYSQETGSPVGRGTDNFAIELTSGQNVLYSGNLAGWGLNGSKCTGFLIGDVDLKGNATFKALIPEPATASLSLLALAGLAARRRRK